MSAKAMKTGMTGVDISRSVLWRLQFDARQQVKQEEDAKVSVLISDSLCGSADSVLQ